MAKVSLRIYNREIESLIDQGQLDEAIAHCRHILNTFSKHLETYRLLGKAYLEVKRYPEAVDIFQRLLMAVPDDFVAHVGMSIINDEQNKMDDAIWHMERAFEVQPSNSAIQAELQRLYGRRDGIEPPKIRLTRGALAHMYVQGELYTQAVSEIKKALEEDPNRQDMQVLLARAYFYAGQKTESAEICDQLIQRYPYCLDANRVLVELLPATERSENIQVYRQRVNELDPYSAHVRESIFRSGDAPDGAVSVDRLEWDGQPVKMDVSWGSSMGVELESDTGENDEQPSWLRAEGMDSSSHETYLPEEVSASLSPENLTDSETNQFEQEAREKFDFNDEPPLPEIAEGELPDWVKAMAPTEAKDGEMMGDSSLEKSEEPVEDSLPDWLREIKSDEEAHQPAQSFEQTDLRDWLPTEKIQEDVAALSGAAALRMDMPEEEPETLPMEKMPEVLPTEETPETLAMEEAPETILPSVEMAGFESAEETEQAPIIEPPELPADETAQEDLPDFIRKVQQPENEPGSPGETIEPGLLGMSAAEQDDALAWLEGLAAKQGAKPEELLTKLEERLEHEPEWVRQAKSLNDKTDLSGEAVEGIEESSTEFSDTEDLPDFLKKLSRPVEESAFNVEEGNDGVAEDGMEETEATFTSPDGLEAVQEIESEKLPANFEETLADELEWINEEPGAAQPAGEISSDVDETGVWLQSLGEGATEEQPDLSDNETPEWLEAVTPADIEDTQSDALKEVEAEAQAEVEMAWTPEEDNQPASEEQPPDWLLSLEGETQAPLEEVRKVEDLPEWLAGLDEEKLEETAFASDSLPEWLRAESETEPASAEPVSSSDWTPVEASPAEPLLEEEPSEQPEHPREDEPSGQPEPSLAPVQEKIQPTFPKEAPVKTRPGATGSLSVAGDPVLTLAQDELLRGNIPAALDTYGKLIKKGRLLDEVIFDLREVLYRYPVEVSIWQALGDAYLRANRLQDALDAYTKAEELLR